MCSIQSGSLPTNNFQFGPSPSFFTFLIFFLFIIIIIIIFGSVQTFSKFSPGSAPILSCCHPIFLFLFSSLFLLPSSYLLPSPLLLHLLTYPLTLTLSLSLHPFHLPLFITMSAKSILEADGKAILNYHLTRAPVIKPTPLPPSSTHNPPPRLASLYFPEDAAVKDVLNQAEVVYPWLLTPGAKFVAKPDQLIKRRGKSGLLGLNKTWAEAREWIEARAAKDVQVETVTGVLRQFLVEPFVPHPQDTEYYINIHSVREVGDLSLVPSADMMDLANS